MLGSSVTLSQYLLEVRVSWVTDMRSVGYTQFW